MTTILEAFRDAWAWLVVLVQSIAGWLGDHWLPVLIGLVAAVILEVVMERLGPRTPRPSEDDQR